MLPITRGFSSIKTKVAIVGFVTVTILVLVITTTLFYYFRNLLKESVFRQQYVHVSEIAEQLSGRVELARYQLALTATSINSDILADPKALHNVLVQASPINMIFDAGLLVVGPDGRVITESMGFPELVGRDLNFRSYVTEGLRSGKPLISAPFKLDVAPYSPVIAMVSPVRDNSDKLICLLVGYHSLGADQFLTSLSNKQLGSSGYIYLLHDRTILMHPDSERILEVIPAGKNRGIDLAQGGFEGSLENYNSRGAHLLSSFKKVSHTNWILGANIPYEEAFKPLDRLLVISLIISALGILLSLLVIWLVTRRFTRPIIDLTGRVAAINTELTEWQPIEIDSGDEVESMANAFNKMMNEVLDVRRQLKVDKEFFRGIIQNTAAPMFVVDQQHNVVFWNNAMAKLSGFSSFQMTGTKQQWMPFYPSKRPVLADLVIDKSLNRVTEFYSTHSFSELSQGSLRAEGWYESLGGKRRYIFFEAAPIINSNNEIIAAVETLEDITERKLAEEATSAQNNFLQVIMDAIPNPVYYKNTDGFYLGCNLAFQTFFGKSLNEVIDQQLRDIMPGEFSALSSEKDRSAIENCRSEHYETRLQRADGSLRDVLVSKAPFFNADGSLAGIVGAFVDITEQRQMDMQIRKMSRAIEQSPSIIVITDTDGLIEYVNPKFTMLTGYTRDEIIGQNPRILKSGEMKPEAYSEMWNILTSGGEWRGEMHNKRKDGSLYWEYSSISPLFDKDGSIAGYLAVKEDITARKAVEVELEKSRRELEEKHEELVHMFELVEDARREWEQTLDHLRDFVLLTDADQCVRRFNRMLSDMTGRDVDALVGGDWRELLSETGFKFERFDGRTGELIHEKSGRVYNINVYEIIHDQLLEGFVVSLNDTTELRAAGKELEKAYAELKDAQLQIFQQEKMASIGQLAAGVAHEINNPMGFISSNLNTLTKYIERMSEFIAAGDRAMTDCGDNPVSKSLQEMRKKLKIDYIMDDARQLIAESQDGAVRVRRIVQDLKSFSRVDQAETALVNLNEALETTINIAWNEIKYVATLNREFGELPEIICFPQQLNQVFLNLLVNAAHAMEGRQGVITIRTWCEGDKVSVSVADSGCGIPEEIRSRIFEPFFTTKEVGKGTGLGLSISYEIVRKHGGEITVESEIGKGTVFTVTLPVGGIKEQDELPSQDL